jgi:hypothetical protein
VQSIILVMVGLRRTFPLLAAVTARFVAAAVVVAAAAALAPSPVRAENATGSFTLSLQVLPRVRTGLPAGQRAAFVAAPGSAALPCGAEGSATCATAATAAIQASGTAAPVVVTVLTDGAPTAIVER